MADSLDVILLTSLASDTMSWAEGEVYSCADAAEKARFIELEYAVDLDAQLGQGVEEVETTKKRRK